MIGIVLMHFLLAPLCIPDAQWSGRETSSIQFRKTLGRFAVRLLEALSDNHSFVDVVTKLFRRIEHFGFKQKRRKKPNVCALLAFNPPSFSPVVLLA
jgi:hypothetical protein